VNEKTSQNVVVAGATSQDAEVAELRAPMACGHPKACLVIKGGDGTDQMGQTFWQECSICAKTDLRPKIEATRASVKRIKRACEAVYKNIDCLNVEAAANCAHSGESMCDELLAALSKQGGT
jgi:hypothetical protein